MSAFTHGPGFIQWDKMSRENWDAVVEALIYRKYNDASVWRVETFRGDGGDGGRDIVVTNVVEPHVRIFQLKFFPEGFSADFRQRRKQIKKSFVAAMKHSPDEWTLIAPKNTTAGEKTYLASLRSFAGSEKKSSLTITEMTAVHLNEEMAKHNDLRVAFEHGEWDQFAKLYHLDRDILPSTPSEARRRFEHAQKAVDAADLDWTWVPEGAGGETMRLVPKDSGSPQRSPVKLEVHTNSELISHDLQRKIDSLFGYGLDVEVDLPAEAVSKFVVLGPPIVAEDDENVRVIFTQLPVIPDKEMINAEIILSREDGKHLSTHASTVEHAGSGNIGYSLRLKVGHALTLTLSMPRKPEDAVSVNINLNFKHAAMSEIVEACDIFLDSLLADTVLTIRLGATSAPLVMGGGIRTELDKAQHDEILYVRDFAEDLDIIQRVFRKRFPLPVSHKKIDRAMVRAIRLLVEGKRTTLPTVREYKVSFTRVDAGEEAIRRLLSGEQLPIWATTESIELETLGQTFTFTGFSIGDQQLGLAGRQRIVQQLRNDSTVNEFETSLIPPNSRFFTAIAREYVKDSGQLLPLTAWDLTDIIEPGNPDFGQLASLPPGLDGETRGYASTPIHARVRFRLEPVGVPVRHSRPLRSRC